MLSTKFSFLEEQILSMLENFGLKNLSENNKKTFLPQLAAQAEYRLGLALLPKLSEAQAEQMVKLIDSEASPEQMAEFWQNAVPDLSDVVETVMRDFAVECQASFT